VRLLDSLAHKLLECLGQAHVNLGVPQPVVARANNELSNGVTTCLPGTVEDVYKDIAGAATGGKASWGWVIDIKMQSGGAVVCVPLAAAVLPCWKWVL
jgi:hypothetical protein